MAGCNIAALQRGTSSESTDAVDAFRPMDAEELSVVFLDMAPPWMLRVYMVPGAPKYPKQWLSAQNEGYMDDYVWYFGGPSRCWESMPYLVHESKGSCVVHLDHQGCRHVYLCP